MNRTAYVLAGVSALTWSTLAAPAFAQGNYPTRPIRILVGFPAGGGQDVVARIVARKLTESLGQQVVVDNRAGASGMIATEMAAKSAPDGYVLLHFATNDTSNAAIYPRIPYDVIRDFAPVAMISNVPYLVVVHPSLPVKTIKELVALARARPGQINYGSTGTGGGSHLATELFKNMTGVDMTHIPYKGGASMQSELFGGQLQVVINSMISLMPPAKAGRVRAVAVTSATRSNLMPDLPTVAESVPGYEAGSWNGSVVPANTPKPIVDLLNREINKLLKAPDTLELFAAQGSEARGGTSEEFSRFIKAEVSKWARVVKLVGIRPEQ